MPRKHDEVIGDYLAAFRAQLHGLTENERNDLVLELEDHILSRLTECSAEPAEEEPLPEMPDDSAATRAALSAARAAKSAARAANSAVRADASAKLTDLAAVRAERAAARAEQAAEQTIGRSSGPAEQDDGQEAPAPPAATISMAEMTKMYPPEVIAKVLAGLGEPADLARRYVGAPPDPDSSMTLKNGRLSPRLAGILVLIMAIGLLAVAFAARSTLKQRERKALFTVTDPAQKRALLERLAMVCARYRRPAQYFCKLEAQSRIFGRDCGDRDRVFHANGLTRLVSSYSADGAGVLYTDTQTLVWLPAMRWYENLPPNDIEGSTYGPSLLLGLLRGRITDEQCRISLRDVKHIKVSDTAVVFHFTGAHFGYGDGEYVVAIDARLDLLKWFTVRRFDEQRYERSHYYSEVLEKQRFDLPVYPETMDLPIPPDAEAHAGIIGYGVRGDAGWKGQHLIGKPMVPFRAPDPRTGRTYTLADFRGKPLLVAVLATWVPWDRLYLAALAQLQQRYASLGLQIAVLAPEVERRITDEFLKKNLLPYPFLTDFTGWRAPHFAAGRFYAPVDIAPTFLAVDAGGRVVAAHGTYFSPMRDDIGVLTGLLAPLLGRETVARVERERAAALASLTEEELLIRAEACFAREDDFTGKEHLQAAIARSQSIRAKLRLCRLYTEYRTDEGKELAEECLAETTASPYPYLMLGDFYRTDKRNNTRAAREYAKALQADPGCWLAHLKSGQNFVADGEYESAVGAYRRALAVVPDNSFAWEQLAVALNGLDRHEEMREPLARAAEMRGLRGGYDDYLMHIRWLQADVATQAREHEAAVGLLRQALLCDPDNVAYLRDCARIMVYDLKRPAEALPLLDRLIRLDRNGRDYNYYGSALDLLGRRTEALAMFDLALRYDPSIEYTWMNIGLTYEHMGDSDNARAAYRRGQALFPGRWRNPNVSINPVLLDE